MTIEGIVFLICFFVVILNIVLFFKVWGMTNNIEYMREVLEDYVEFLKKDHE